MSRIVIDGRMINESGIGRYLRNLLDNLQKLDQGNEYYILYLKHDYDTWKYHSHFHKILADFKWYTVAEQLKLHKILHDLKPDLVHFPHFNVPILYGGKFVVTIHDLIHQHYSMEKSSTHGKLIFNTKKFGYKKVFSAAVRKSLKILVPSHFVKQQLVSEWKVKSEKVVITPEAVDAKLTTIGGQMVLPKARTPSILYVGNAHPHKNIEELILAFKKVKAFSELKDLKLVLVGKENYFWKAILKRFHDDKIIEDIIYTGYVSDERLAALYRNATVYVEPSLEEGFGLPILEAFANSCPVVASDIGSLKEVGEDAAIYFNPHDASDMANKILYVLNNVSVRKALIEKGKKRVKLFSWKKMAEQTLKVYNNA